METKLNKVNRTLKAENYDINGFLRNLALHVPHPFDIAYLQDLIEMYVLGTVDVGKNKGALTLPFINTNGEIMAVCTENNLYWPCMFGEHLLTQYPAAPVNVTETPRAALYGTLYYGGIWLAGNVTGVLNGRVVTVRTITDDILAMDWRKTRPSVFKAPAEVSMVAQMNNEEADRWFSHTCNAFLRTNSNKSYNTSTQV